MKVKFCDLVHSDPTTDIVLIPFLFSDVVFQISVHSKMSELTVPLYFHAEVLYFCAEFISLKFFSYHTNFLIV